MTVVLRTEALTKQFGRTEALRGVTFEVPEGAIYALVGANGAGKTTLIKLLMNIFLPTEGRAEVLGTASKHLTGRALNRIGYVSENQEHPEWMTVRQVLDYLRPFYPKWDRALEAYLVEQFNLPLGRKLRQLSRGMRMKTAMVAALAFRPSLLVLDEPFSGLDPLVRDELIEGLLDRAQETTIFLSSHDLAEIESFSTHVGFLEQGRLLFSEELPALSERFREVTVTLEAPAEVRQVPPEWLGYEQSKEVARFVHSQWLGAETMADLKTVFPVARNLTAEPMTLRSIFLAIARSRRSERAARPVGAEAEERSRA